MINKNRVVVFVGTVVPNEESNTYIGLNKAGNYFQIRFLNTIVNNGIIPNLILSIRPTSPFAEGEKILYRKSTFELIKSINSVYIPLINIKGLKFISANVYILSTIISLFLFSWGKKEKIIFSYNVSSPHAIVFRIIKGLFKVKIFPIIADLHSSIHVENSILKKIRDLDYRIQCESLKHMNGLIVLNKNIINDHAPNVKFALIDGAIPLSVYNSLSNLEEIEFASIINLTYIGELTRFKGVDLILDAFNEIKGEEFRLTLVGKGELEHEIMQRSKDDHRIHFKGFITDFDIMINIYKESSILISSLISFDNLKNPVYIFPSKILEYLATGKPIISNYIPGMDEIYLDMLYILNKINSVSLIELVFKISKLTNYERKQLAQKSKYFVKTNKIWERQAKKIVSLITG